jgi:nucleotide-binding universal stress UspA family protein
MHSTNIASILVPVDDSACSTAAADYAATVARVMNARITLLHAWHPTDSIAPGLDGATVGTDSGGSVSLYQFLEIQAKATLERQRARLEGAGVLVDAQLVEGPTRSAILDAAADHDLVVIGTHGRSGLSRLMIGSVAEWVVRHAHVPVLTIRGIGAEVPPAPQQVVDG